MLEYALQGSGFTLRNVWVVFKTQKGQHIHDFIEVLIKTQHSDTMQTMFSTDFHNVCTVYTRIILM